MRADEIESAEAFRRVDEMLRAREQLQPFLIAGETLNAARERRGQIAASAERTASETAFVLKLTAFDLLLDRYFRDPRKAMFRHKPSGQEAA